MMARSALARLATRPVVRTAKRLGVRTVAVFSEADARAPHVKFADEAVCVGAPPSAQSYLDQAKVLEAC